MGAKKDFLGLPWWAWLIGGAFAFGVGAVVYKLRGLRNNNPGNIKRNPLNDVNGPDPWKGLDPTKAPGAPGADPTFLQFVAPVWGIRAMLRILGKYQERGASTIRDYITQWLGAPRSGIDDSGNSVESYVKYVSEKLGVAPDVRLSGDPRIPLAMAITRRENAGQNPYDAALFSEALKA